MIEPCASIVAACLPTLGPILNGWRLPESVVQSVRSALSIHSGGSASRSHQHAPIDIPHEAARQSPAAKKAWMELPSDSATGVGGLQGLELSDLEFGRGK